MELESEKVELLVGKESKDIVDAVAKLVGDIKAKKELTQIASESLPGLYNAIEGYDKVDDEMKSEFRNATIAYAGLEVAKILTE